MEEMQHDAATTEQGVSNATWWSSDFMEKFESISLPSLEDSLNNKESPRSHEEDALSSQSASQILWSTGMLSQRIPNGFYSVIPEKRLRELFEKIPTLDELHSLGSEGFKPDVVLVDSKKDKKLSMLKQLIVTLARGLNSNPPSLIKKIAGLVADFYKKPHVESPAKAALEQTSHAFDIEIVQLLGQIKHGSCRPRAIMFKVLADAVGLETRLMVGLPSDGAMECVDSYKHMSAVVVLNSVEVLVDLMRFPGQLIPWSTKAIFMSHISAAGESDSAENDSCDSPLEPNSPLYVFSERVNADSFSHSEPNRRSRKKAIAEQRTASSSPEHPSFRSRGHSMLSGNRHSIRGYADDVASSRSEGASTSEARRIRRRSISITPEIGDDIVRAVRAMNESLKQNRHVREQGDNKSFTSTSDDNYNDSEIQKNISTFDMKSHDAITGGRSTLYAFGNINAQKAISLPSSPHGYGDQTSGRSGPSGYIANDILVSTWNKVIESPMFHNKPLLPFQEWNIDFSELIVGTRVGIGFFGEVFRGVWNGTDVAIKVFLEQDLTTENMEDFCNEISILSRLRHPNVILFLGACTKPPRLSMVTEYMEMGSLYYLVHLSGQKKKLSWRRRLKMLRDICRGLMCIHRMKIVHRDVKSANCLVNKHMTVKICDFGLSRIMVNTPIRDSSSAGTPEWMAPELIRNEPFTEKCDIFSLGVIMWELCTLSRPWEGVPPERVVYAVANEGSRLDVPEGPLGRLISDCWAEPHERPSCEEILSRLLECENSLC